MTVAHLLARCRRRGITLTANGERLAFDAPTGAMDAALRECLTAAKAELLGVLACDYVAAARIVLARVPKARRDDLRELFRERWAVCVEDGGLSDAEGARIAYREMAAEAERMKLTDGATATIPDAGVTQRIGDGGGVGHSPRPVSLEQP